MDDSALSEEVLEGYRSAFGADPEWLARSPGRVNLIGEHTDYNGGWALPFAIGLTLRMAAGPAEDGFIVRALDRGEEVEFDPGDLPVPRPGHWSNYVVGVLADFRDRGIRLPPARIAFASRIPAGGGLSSSAALTTATALVLDRMTSADLPREELARAAQAAEHTYAGVRCGILDQSAILLARAGSALLLDCRTGAHRIVPMRLGDCRFLVCDSRISHDLAAGGYNLRRVECESALRKLQRRWAAMADLRDCTPEILREAEGTLSPAEHGRALHQVEENRRVLAAERALEAGDLAGLGRLLSDSHRSLRDNFEVTVPETDFLAEAAQRLEGCLGARMTGGGFGGNVLALVRRDREEEVGEAWMRTYRDRFGIKAEVFACEPSEGAALVEASVESGAGRGH